MSHGFQYGISVSAYERFEFPTLGENICRKLVRTAISQHLTGRNMTGTGRCVDECSKECSKERGLRMRRIRNGYA